MSWEEVGFWKAMLGWLEDPVRRWHMVTRILETAAPAWLALHFFWKRLPTWVVVALILLGEFMLYEFLLEPRMGAGPYWERGPRDFETFVVP